METYDAVGENNFNPDSYHGNHTKQHATWSPYDNNGGTVMAVASEDYLICAADTRVSTGYSIMRASMVTMVMVMIVLVTRVNIKVDVV